jgi:hypothetical protein
MILFSCGDWQQSSAFIEVGRPGKGLESTERVEKVGTAEDPAGVSEPSRDLIAYIHLPWATASRKFCFSRQEALLPRWSKELSDRVLDLTDTQITPQN